MAPFLTQTAAWQDLQLHRDATKSVRLSDTVLADPSRLEAYEIKLDGLRYNYALNAVTPKTMELLVALARQQNLDNERARMFRGEKINITENRAALHIALRQKSDAPLWVDGRDIIQDVRDMRRRVSEFVGHVRDGSWKGATGKRIKHVVNIGIGGSDLGTRLAVHALDSFMGELQVHFAANVDAFELSSILRNLDPEETLFVVVSKTFTSQETLMNARTARHWLVSKLGEKAVARHFVAVSCNHAEVEAFGIHLDNLFPMWDWVGGRYSLWSAVGLGLALAVGMDHFAKLCDGAAAMDAHFLSAPLDQNMPVVLALMGIWNRNFLGTTAQVVLPYSERLRDLPRYLQQLEMESNGKSVTREGEAVDYGTAPVIFGDCGSVAQHSFHQFLHQGTDIVPAEFIGIAQDDQGQPEHHRVLLANMVAQAGAFVFGQRDAAKPCEVYAGGRPCNLILLDQLDPYSLGLLLALYEHKIFVQGIIWNINSFDQPGVELGKRMAKALEEERVSANPANVFLADLWSRIAPVLSK